MDARPQDFHPQGMARYLVPVPPSTNKLYATVGRRRVKAMSYLAWINEAGWEIKSQHPFLIPGQVSVEYVCPINPKRDLGNFEKGLSDLLVRMGVIEDDKFITDIRLLWARDIDKVQITVKPCLI